MNQMLMALDKARDVCADLGIQQEEFIVLSVYGLNDVQFQLEALTFDRIWKLLACPELSFLGCDRAHPQFGSRGCEFSTVINESECDLLSPALRTAVGLNSQETAQ